LRFRVMRPGSLIPKMPYHAGVIARDAGDKKAAQKFFESAAKRAVCEDLQKQVSEAAKTL
jgi:hypothetical protein